MKQHLRLIGSLFALGLMALASPAIAADKTKINFVLDWLISGRHTGWFTALEKGYYADEGLDVSISRGFGSADGVKRLRGGQADIAFNDFSTAILARAKEGAPVKMVGVIYAEHPSAIFTHKKYNITKPKDLEGKTLSDSAGSTQVLFFSAYADLAGIDASKVDWALVAPDAKMQIFLADKVHGTAFYTMQLPLMEEKTAATGGVNMLKFGDYMKVYSNGILSTDEFLSKNADAVKAFVRASMKGWQYAFDHPEEAVGMLQKKFPLLNEKVSLQELAVVKDLMLSPEAKEHGLGYMDADKVKATRDLTLRLFKVDSDLPLDDTYSNAYLPKKM